MIEMEKPKKITVVIYLLFVVTFIFGPDPWNGSLLNSLLQTVFDLPGPGGFPLYGLNLWFVAGSLFVLLGALMALVDWKGKLLRTCAGLIVPVAGVGYVCLSVKALVIAACVACVMVLWKFTRGAVAFLLGTIVPAVAIGDALRDLVSSFLSSLLVFVGRTEGPRLDEFSKTVHVPEVWITGFVREGCTFHTSSLVSWAS